MPSSTAALLLASLVLLQCAYSTSDGEAASRASTAEQKRAAQPRWKGPKSEKNGWYTATSSTHSRECEGGRWTVGGGRLKGTKYSRST